MRVIRDDWEALPRQEAIAQSVAFVCRVGNQGEKARMLLQQLIKELG